MDLWSFPIGLYVEAMHLQCFPPTLRECALRVLLDHVLAEYGLGYSVWFLDMACVKRKHQLVLTWGQCLSVWQDLCILRGVSQPCHHSTHTHNNTYLHVHQTHNGHTALCKSTTTDVELSWTYAQTSSAVIISYQNSNVEQPFFVAFFSCLVCGRFYTLSRKKRLPGKFVGLLGAPQTTIFIWACRMDQF